MRASILALTLLPGAALAGSESNEDRLVINPISDTEFEVVETVNSEPRTFWCGAATYHERRRGLSETDPIWLLSPRGPAQTAPGRKGVVFTTDPARFGTQNTPLSIGVTEPGVSLKSFQARGFCRDAFTRATK